jgi:hypothetical protein
VRYYGWKIREGEVLRMDNEKTRKDSFTATERICHIRTSEILWMDFFAGEILRMDFLDGGIMRRG